ncbi:MAG: NifB/NifX family molybdenum-iron cluster-binding protein [Bacteroidota bacterium]|jgi:predicted Fe-Mo cluster-binding NifX family protein|nr:NifB/NifX family molybdenum-iron cluster-binding protein [Bacteroidota bacterium]
MTIAISTTGNGWDSPIDERFGRARGFFLIDENSNETRYLDNAENVEAAHGAGPAAARVLANAGVGVLLTGRVGPKAGDALKAAGIRVVSVPGGQTNRDTWNAYLRVATNHF